MMFYKNCVRDSVLLFLYAFVCSAAEDDGFLNVNCQQAQDCYILDDRLALACWYNVNKCKCQNTFASDFHLKFENNQCLMSKYGPCGTKGELSVGCQDLYVCIDNQCRDPKDTRPEAVKLTPFVFTKKCTDGCSFGEMNLRCNNNLGQCECAKIYVADKGDDYWDIRSYDGDNNCSVGKFGPCGTKNGITIGCHGDGITCVSGTCLNANRLTSDVGEDCASKKNCRSGLLCSAENVCIEPFSLPEGKLCSADNECQKGLQCKRPARPWSSAFCEKM